MLYLSSDLHIGHANIINLCKRPFNSLEDMEDSIIYNWNQTVSTKDEVILAGDVAFKCNSSRAIAILKKLNGNKNLVIGNHDHKYLKDQKFCDCFGWIKDYHNFVYNKRLYVVSHYPFLSWDRMHRGSVCLCGHRHLKQQEDSGIKRIDVGVDAWNFTPVSMIDIEEAVNSRGVKTGFDAYFEQRMYDPQFAKMYNQERAKIDFWQRIRNWFKWK